MKKTFEISKVNGELIGDFTSPFRTLKNGNYTCTIEPKKVRRSISQNSLLWLWFACISDNTGNDTQTLHDVYSAKFLKQQVLFNGKQVEIVRRTSSLSKDEFSVFLDKIQAEVSAEFGISLPTPADACFDDFLKHYNRYVG